MNLPTESRLRRDGIVCAAALAVFALCALIVSDGKVHSVEHFFFRIINELPSSLRPVVQLLQYPGVLVVPLIAAAIALAAKRWRLAAALVVAVPLKLGAEHVAKMLVVRQRPGASDPHPILRGVPAHGPSFTSGHAFVAFVTAGLLVVVLPRRWAIVAVVAATMVCLARIYLGAHNPLDVVGGGALGLATAAVLDVVFDVGRFSGRQARPAERPATLAG